MAAVKAGTASELVNSSEIKAMTGPKIKPRPKAAPVSPRPRVRLVSSVMSLSAACAVERLAPNKPSTSRDRITSSSEVAKPSMMKLRQVVTWLMSSRGLRPKRSESAPMAGTPMSWARGKTRNHQTNLKRRPRRISSGVQVQQRQDERSSRAYRQRRAVKIGTTRRISSGSWPSALHRSRVFTARCCS